MCVHPEEIPPPRRPRIIAGNAGDADAARRRRKPAVRAELQRVEDVFKRPRRLQVPSEGESGVAHGAVERLVSYVVCAWLRADPRDEEGGERERR